MVLFNSIHLFFDRFMYIFLLSVNFEECFFKCCSIINCVSVLASIYVLVKIDENLQCTWFCMHAVAGGGSGSDGGENGVFTGEEASCVGGYHSLQQWSSSQEWELGKVGDEGGPCFPT